MSLSFSSYLNETYVYPTVDLDDPEQLYLWRIGHIAAIISIVLSFCGATFIVFSFAIFKGQLKNFRNRLILYMTFNNLLFSILHLFSHSYFYAQNEAGEPHDSRSTQMVCQFDGFIIHFLAAGSFFWVIVISYYLFKRVVLNQQGHVKDYYLMVVVWGGTLAVALVILCFPNVGMRPRSLWCCVNFGALDNFDSRIWPLITFIIPCVGGFLFVLVTYLMVIIKVRKTRKAVSASITDDLTIDRRKKENQLVRTLLYYPLVYLYQWVVVDAMLVYVIVYFSDLPRIDWLFVMKVDIVATANVNLAAFINSIVYGFNSNLREEYRKYLRSKIDASSQVTASNLSNDSAGERRGSISTKFMAWIEKKL